MDHIQTSGFQKRQDVPRPEIHQETHAEHGGKTHVYSPEKPRIWWLMILMIIVPIKMAIDIYIYILYCDLPHQLAGWKHIEIYGRSKADVSQVQGFLGLVTICLVVFRLKNMRKVSDDEWWTIYHSQDFWIKECSKPPSSCTWWVNKLTTSKPRKNPLVIELRGTPQIVIILET